MPMRCASYCPVLTVQYARLLYSTLCHTHIQVRFIYVHHTMAINNATLFISNSLIHSFGSFILQLSCIIIVMHHCHAVF
jgi:hypothetical protein